MANERTFLAWMRTALALLAAGLVLDQFAAHLTPRALLTGLALGLMLAAAGMSLSAYLQWQRVQTAMRRQQALPRSPLLLPAALVLTVSALTLALWVGVA